MFELDRAMKILAARYPHVFRQLLFGENPNIKFEKVEDSAINVAEHRSDKIFCFLEQGKRKIISFEFVTQPNQNDLLRFHAKNGLLTASYLIEVVTVIVYLERGRYRAFPNEYVARIGRTTTKTQFSRILLWEYQDRIRSGEFRELAPLLVLFEDKPTQETLLEEKALIKSVEDEQEQGNLLALAIMIAFRKFNEHIIKELFYEEYNMLKEASFVKEWIQESWEKGEREGKTKGLREGLREGLRKGQVRIIFKQLDSILGRVSIELEQRIHSLSDSDIEKLSEDLLRMKNTTDLEEWLRLREENSKN
jgi:predicted transposase YdaD